MDLQTVDIINAPMDIKVSVIWTQISYNTALKLMEEIIKYL